MWESRIETKTWMEGRSTVDGSHSLLYVNGNSVGHLTGLRRKARGHDSPCCPRGSHLLLLPSRTIVYYYVHARFTHSKEKKSYPERFHRAVALDVIEASCFGTVTMRESRLAEVLVRLLLLALVKLVSELAIVRYQEIHPRREPSILLAEEPEIRPKQKGKKSKEKTRRERVHIISSRCGSADQGKAGRVKKAEC